MIIISHRGYWKEESEKNTETAFQRSFELNFGTETDVRDSMGELVISHDMPLGEEITLDTFLSLLPQKDLLLAINVKADGLAESIQQVMKRHALPHWFVFDMSIPDMRAHLHAGNPVYARMSEVEKNPVWFDQVEGIWLDGFDSEWFDIELINQLINKGKCVCVVSSELHGRAQESLWEKLLPLAKEDALILCTDYPEVAREFFNRTS